MNKLLPQQHGGGGGLGYPDDDDITNNEPHHRQQQRKSGGGAGLSSSGSGGGDARSAHIPSYTYAFINTDTPSHIYIHKYVCMYAHSHDWLADCLTDHDLLLPRYLS